MNTLHLRRRKKDKMYYVRQFSRIFMGILFILSGYVKAVDPYGFSLKIDEYFVSFGMDFMTPLSMFFSIAAITAEFMIGIALLFSIQMRITSWLLFLFMSFFLVLTFWLAYALDIVQLYNSLFQKNYTLFVVTDCGCFGDFITLTNKETFYKNVFFMIFTLVIFAQNKKYKIHNLMYITQWGPLLLGLIFVLFMQIYCLRHEPWHDFRPWFKGNFIAAETYSEAPELDYIFIYKHKDNNTSLELTTEDLINISDDSVQCNDFENNYIYSDRKEKIIKKGIDAVLSDFSLTDINNNTDYKEDIISQAGFHFILIIRDTKKANLKRFDDIMEFANKCLQNNIPFIAVTGSTPNEIQDFKLKHNILFPIYFSDETPLKTAIRNNPGLILLKDGYVMDKWSYVDIPNYNKFHSLTPKYNSKLNTYKAKKPPILPNGINLDSINYPKNNNSNE